MSAPYLIHVLLSLNGKVERAAVGSQVCRILSRCGSSKSAQPSAHGEKAASTTSAHGLPSTAQQHLVGAVLSLDCGGSSRKPLRYAGTRQSNTQVGHNAWDPCHGCGGLNSTPKAASCFAFQYASVKPIVVATNVLVTAVASRSALVKGTIVMVA